MPAPLGLPRNAHVFVDETKAREFILVAAWLAPGRLASARKRLRAMVPPGQPRRHFKKLNDARRRQLLGAIDQMGVQITVTRSAAGKKIARDACVATTLEFARDHGATRVAIETDDTAVLADLAIARRECPGIDVLHVHAAGEPLLWVSDAVAWCLQRGGRWKAVVRPWIVVDQAVE